MTKKNKIRQHSEDNKCLTADTINRFLTGRLDSREMKLVEKHIEQCEFCADAVDGYKSMQLKDTLHNTVRQINNQIDSRTSHGVYRFLSVNKRIIAYSSLAASVLILTGLFLLINNLKIQENKIVTDNLIVEESKQSLPSAQEQIKEKGSPATYDSFPVGADKSRPSPAKKEIIPVTEKSAFKASDKSDIPEIDKKKEKVLIMEPEIDQKEEIALIMEPEAEMDFEETTYHDTKMTEAPAARAAEISAPIAYDRNTGGRKTGLAQKVYTRSEGILATQMPGKEEVLDEETVLTILDELPRFENGGLEHFSEYVQKELEYPRRAKKSGIEGEVSVKFTIDTTGRVTDTEIISSVDSVLNREALRVVNSSPAWIPGRQDGKPVNVTYVINVIFKID